MTAALSPDQAIAYVRELSADVRASVVLGADGLRLAGDPALEAPARALIAALGDDTALTLRTDAGVVFTARSSTHALITVAGPLSLVGPTRLDTLTAVAAMGGEMAPAARSAAAPSAARTAAERVISASQPGL